MLQDEGDQKQKQKKERRKEERLNGEIRLFSLRTTSTIATVSLSMSSKKVRQPSKTVQIAATRSAKT